MKIYEYGKDVISNPDGCVITLGFFDGVHIAHRDLIDTARIAAQQKNIPSGVFTFKSESEIKSGSKRIYTTEEKLSIFEEIGVDFTIVAEFDSISHLKAEQFVKDVLIDSLNCKIAVAGFNFRYGKGAMGNSNTLSEDMEANGRECIIRDEMALDGVTVSATLIRNLLSDGKIERANRLLGRPYSICGIVAHGNGVGKKLGFPTVNTEFDDNNVPLKQGVYRSALSLGGRIYPAITNVGICPTFEKRNVHAETYILDFDGNIYNEKITLYILEFMREEKRFESTEELKKQIIVDKNNAINRFGEESWQELGLK